MSSERLIWRKLFLQGLAHGEKVDYWDNDKMRNILKKPVGQRTSAEKAAITRTRNQEAKDRKEAAELKAKEERDRPVREAKEARDRKTFEDQWRKRILREIDYIARVSGVPTEILMERIDRFLREEGGSVFDGLCNSLECVLSFSYDKLLEKTASGSNQWWAQTIERFLGYVKRIADSLAKKAKEAEEAAVRAAEEAAARAAEKEAIAVVIARARDKQAKEAKAMRPRKRPVDPRPLKDRPCTEGKERSARSGRCVKPCRPSTARNEAGRCTKRQAEGKPMLVRGPRAR